MDRTTTIAWVLYGLSIPLASLSLYGVLSGTAQSASFAGLFVGLVLMWTGVFADAIRPKGQQST